MKVVILMLLMVSGTCQAKASFLIESPTTFPLILTNESPKYVTLNIDLRVDYYYNKGKQKTFLPASTTNKRVEIGAGKTITIDLYLPLQLHEPYNTIKKSLRNQKYEQTGIVVRGVIGNAKEPKRFFTVEQDIHAKKALRYSLQST